jgi:hypothetical protein
LNGNKNPRPVSRRGHLMAAMVSMFRCFAGRVNFFPVLFLILELANDAPPTRYARLGQVFRCCQVPSLADDPRQLFNE